MRKFFTLPRQAFDLSLIKCQVIISLRTGIKKYFPEENISQNFSQYFSGKIYYLHFYEKLFTDTVFNADQ